VEHITISLLNISEAYPSLISELMKDLMNLLTKCQHSRI